MVERERGTEDQGPSCRRDLAMVPSSSAHYAKPFPLKEAPPSYRPYPPPLAKYQNVVADRNLFMDSLEKLHGTMGTKFMIPTIGGKELDLHRLFVEVTSRGGLEQIIRERRWKEVTAVFSFPATATNASFVLRKYYISLLHHYEQIYFFGAQGWTSPPPVPLQSPSPMPVPPRGLVEPELPSPEAQTSVTVKRRKSTGEFLPGASPLPSMVSPVVGVIDGKFEHGYLVSVRVGTQQLKGVLYYAKEHSVSQVPQDSGFVANNSGRDATVAGPRRRRRRKKSEIRKRDPAHPKLNRSGYNFFFAEQHARLKLLHPGRDREISKMIGELWNKLTETGKAVYQEKGFKDKERYRSEMEVYRERQKTGVLSDAVPIQQRRAAPDVATVEVDTNMDAEEGESLQTVAEEDDSLQTVAEEDDSLQTVAEEDDSFQTVAEEGDSLKTVESDTSSRVFDSEEEKTADKDLEIAKSPEAGYGSESANAAPGVSTEGDAFELGKRDQKVDENKDQGSGLENVSGLIKEESVASEGH
ncbi:hypothetical protein NE237_014720 [Protea cynaroides]|uniref:High mobility group B protein 15 n=1 Tax=Protea cynaroides TaxID=273540 RepID=A0A9Q0KCS3_9MAGN|nr:hypothetical protein NE237_014720 [Protea cynaroides]